MDYRKWIYTIHLIACGHTYIYPHIYLCVCAHIHNLATACTSEQLEHDTMSGGHNNAAAKILHPDCILVDLLLQQQ